MGRRSRKNTSNTNTDSNVNANANANTNVSQGLVKKGISNLLLLGGVKGGKPSSQQLPVRLEDPQDHHDHQEQQAPHQQQQQQQQKRRPKTKPPLSPVLQTLRGVGSSRRNVSKGSSHTAGAAAAAAALTKTTKKSSGRTKYNNTPPPVLVITVPDDDGVDDVPKLKDGGKCHDVYNVNVDANNVSMTSTINTSGDYDNQNHHHDDGDDGDDQDVPEWTAVFNDHDDGDEIDAAVDEIDDAAALVDVNHNSTDFPDDEQHCSNDQQQHQQQQQRQRQQHVHVGSSGVIVVQEEAQDVEEVEIEFYYRNDSEEECEWEDEQPSDCQNEDNVFFALPENNPFLSNKDGSKQQPLLPTFVPSPSGVTDFDDVFGFDHKAVGQPAVAASTGAMAATPSSAAMQFSNGFGSPLKLSIDDEDEEYGLFDNSDHHLSFLAEATELRMLQQPKLDLDDDHNHDDDDDDEEDDEEQDHQQLLQDLQREAIYEDYSTSSHQATTDDQGSHVVVRMTSSYESFDVVKVKVENSKTEHRQDGEVDEQEQVGEEEEEDDDEKYNLHKVYASSENLIELEENVPTPVRGSQRKNRTSVLEELGLAPISTTTTSSSATTSTASTTSKSSERTCATKTDSTDKTSTKSLTLCADQYGPATFYKVLNDLKDNRNITELYVFRSWHSSSGCQRSTNDIIQLFDVIQSIKFLKVLKISNFSGPELDGAICDTQWCHPTLSNLQLHIRQGSISKQTLEQLAELPVLDELVMEMNESFPFHFALSSKSLTKLTIVANYFDLDNMHLVETINMLRENRSLRSLVIEPPMKLRAFKLLAYSLRSNTTLEELTVSLIPSHLDNDGVSGDDVEAPNHSSLDGFDDETSAAIEVANLLRTNSTLTCLKNKNSAFIKVGQKGASDVLDALVGSNVVVDFTLFDEKEHNGFTKSKDAKLNRNKAVSEISLFKNFFSCSSIGVN
eukprot:CAMPEP_0113518668 /NCGR_PEP_ID=MMETSP0014_2-20120614/43078_1 /TAXON_ID=2857 /ORGANISM="Nitzschia sp." /LENGTH=954 /DNA_ID=CAMNT_0000416273 /DNA_START=394 /DNA_END=3255 /DNA_ORIENTATION=+ /assembly_acc=CAM_ASM_000159